MNDQNRMTNDRIAQRASTRSSRFSHWSFEHYCIDSDFWFRVWSFAPMTLLSTSTLAIACALLSVIVVLRRWAFIGEGISHSGLGGAGTAWLLMLIIPALDKPWVPYVGIVVF